MGRCEPSTGIEPVGRLVAQVMSRKPYRSAKRVFWVVDNGSSHRGQAAVRRLAKVHSNLILRHTPVHASWLNQVEIYFSLVQRKVLTRTILLLSQMSSAVSRRTRNSPIKPPARSTGDLIAINSPSFYNASKQGESLRTRPLGERAKIRTSRTCASCEPWSYF
jgi:DDE superfamily endonuclease